MNFINSIQKDVLQIYSYEEDKKDISKYDNLQTKTFKKEYVYNDNEKDHSVKIVFGRIGGDPVDNCYINGTATVEMLIHNKFLESAIKNIIEAPQYGPMYSQEKDRFERVQLAEKKEYFPVTKIDFIFGSAVYQNKLIEDLKKDVKEIYPKDESKFDKQVDKTVEKDYVYDEKNHSVKIIFERVGDTGRFGMKGIATVKLVFPNEFLQSSIKNTLEEHQWCCHVTGLLHPIVKQIDFVSLEAAQRAQYLIFAYTRSSFAILPKEILVKLVHELAKFIINESYICKSKSPSNRVYF